MNLDEATVAIRSREPIFHRPEHGTAHEDFDRIIAAEYFEVGASGRRYSREFVLDVLSERHAGKHVEDELIVTEFVVQRLEGETFLATYTLEQPEKRMTRRSTIWQHTQDGWKALYHQGTVITYEQKQILTG